MNGSIHCFLRAACAGSACLSIILLSLGVTWDIDLPEDGSWRTKYSDVAGSGSVTGDPGQAGVFGFGYKDGSTYTPENEIAVTATEDNGVWSWSTTLSPPNQPGHWTPSPLEMEMPVGDHAAWIKFVSSGTYYDSTLNHVVTDPD